MLLLVWNVALAAPDPVREAVAAVAGRADLPPGELIPRAVIPQGTRGTVVQLQAVLHGVPVDLSVNVRLGPDGTVRRVVTDPVPARRIDGTPLSLERALALAPFPGDGDARLSWQATGSALRQVWTIERHHPSDGLQVPRIRLDAVSGLVLSVDDAAETESPLGPLAGVYVHNPVVDSGPLSVELPLAVDALSDPRLTMYQCRDLGETSTWNVLDGELEVHHCSWTPALGPVHGNYLFDAVPWPVDPARDEDDFVASQVYWNVHQGLDWFTALGWVPASDFDPRLDVLVNLRKENFWTEQTASDPSQPLDPYDNAYSSGGYFDFEENWIPPILVFGQGSEIDYGYDADVVHHELGHFIVKSLHGPSYSLDSPYGPSIRASTLNEGLADYFSAALHGDPVLAEYAAGTDRTAIRDLSGSDSCRGDLYGESHYDSLPFSQGLWQVRATLGEADARILDQAVLDSLPVMGLKPDYDTATDVILEIVRERLGDVADALETRWDERGALDCPPVLDVVPSDEPFREFSQVPGSYTFSDHGPVPGYLQYRVEIPDGGARVTLRFDQAEYLGMDLYGSNLPLPLGVVGRSGDAIRWIQDERFLVYDFGDGSTLRFSIDQWVADGPEVGTTVETGTHPNDTEEYLFHTHSVTWDVAEPGPYVFQLTNAEERSAVAYDLVLALEPLPEGDEEPALTDGPEPDGEEPAGGCGCDTGGGAGWGWVLALWGVRRRTGAGRRHGSGA